MSELVMFDDNGDPPGHYDVMNFQVMIIMMMTMMMTMLNFQVMDNASMEYVSIGSWHNGTLALNRFIQIVQIIWKITFKIVHKLVRNFALQIRPKPI